MEAVPAVVNRNNDLRPSTARSRRSATGGDRARSDFFSPTDPTGNDTSNDAAFDRLRPVEVTAPPKSAGRGA
jgi:hypothetical protein